MFRWLFLLRWTAFDAVLAATLVATSFAQADTMPGEDWWLFTPLLVAGLLLRRFRPVLAVMIASLGFIGHHLQLGPAVQAIDLAVPLTFTHWRRSDGRGEAWCWSRSRSSACSPRWAHSTWRSTSTVSSRKTAR